MLEKVFDCKAMGLQQGARVAIRCGAGDALKPFVFASEFMNKSLNLIVGQLQLCDMVKL